MLCVVDKSGDWTAQQQPPVTLMTDETDTHSTIQRLCERIHQLEAVSRLIVIHSLNTQASLTLHMAL